jgi:two-component system chemotaxis response regulator CheB
MPVARVDTKPTSVVVIGASAGGVQALTKVLQGLPKDFPAAVVVVQHRSATAQSLLPTLLGRRTALPVIDAQEGDALKPGTVYIARPDLHLTVTESGHFAYHDGRRIRHVLSSANPLFTSAANAYGPHAVGVVLTGSGHDGTDGVQAIRDQGGIVIAQDQTTSERFEMPRSATATGAVDQILPLDDIAPALIRLATIRPSSEGGKV